MIIDAQHLKNILKASELPSVSTISKLVILQIAGKYKDWIEDLDLTPFDARDGRGKMYQLFGDQMNNILNELNEALAA